MTDSGLNLRPLTKSSIPIVTITAALEIDFETRDVINQ
jgi:hypothetical protein